MIAILQKNESTEYYLLRRERNNRGVYRWRYIVNEEKKYYAGEPFMFEQDAEEVLAEMAKEDKLRYAILDRYKESELGSLLKDPKPEPVPAPDNQKPEESEF